MKRKIVGDGQPQEFEEEHPPAGTHADMTGLGHLQAVATTPEFRRHKFSGGDDLIECVFDTGIAMYVPPALFDTMAFSLGENDET